MFLETDSIAEFVSETAKSEGYWGEWPTKKGLYYWDACDEKFYDLDEKIMKAAEEWKKLNRLKRTLKGES